MPFLLFIFLLLFGVNVISAAPMSQEDHRACRDGVTGMVFLKFRRLLDETARKRVELEVAQGKRDKMPLYPLANIEKIDCQPILGEFKDIYQKFSTKYGACLYAGTLEQFAAIYADDNLDPKVELRKQIYEQIYSSFSFERCAAAKNSMEATLLKLRDGKSGLELCETSATGLKEIGVIMREQCRE